MIGTISTAKYQNSQNNSYIVTDANGIVYYVPSDSKNADNQAVQAWVAGSGVVASS